MELETTCGYSWVDLDIAEESLRPTINFTFHDQNGNKLDGWLFSNKTIVREKESP